MVHFDDIEGVSRGLAELNPGVLRASSLMPDAGIPAADTPYLAFTRSAVARKDLDPSLALALAQALNKAYSPQTVLNDKGSFPTFGQPETFRPNPTAEDFYRNGPSFLSRHLSPTIAAFLFKLLLILTPVVALLAPLMGPLPKAYQFYVTRKVAQWFNELEEIEREYPSANEARREVYCARLTEINSRLQGLCLPIVNRYFVQQVFSARGHAQLLKERLEKMPPADLPAAR